MTVRPSSGVLPSGENKRQFVRELFDDLAPRYDLGNRLISLGLDQGWRRAAVEALGLAPRSLVVDLACGTGDLSRMVETLGSLAVGIDLSFPMLRAGGRRGGLVQADAGALPVASGSIDGVVCGFALRNFADLSQVFREAARVLRAGGRVVLLEVDVPRNPLFRMGHGIWFGLVVPALGFVLGRHASYRYLGASFAYLPSREDLFGMLRAAGFGDIRLRSLSWGLVQLISATRLEPF